MINWVASIKHCCPIRTVLSLLQFFKVNCQAFFTLKQWSQIQIDSKRDNWLNCKEEKWKKQFTSKERNWIVIEDNEILSSYWKCLKQFAGNTHSFNVLRLFRYCWYK